MTNFFVNNHFRVYSLFFFRIFMHAMCMLYASTCWPKDLSILCPYVCLCTGLIFGLYLCRKSFKVPAGLQCFSFLHHRVTHFQGKLSQFTFVTGISINTGRSIFSRKASLMQMLWVYLVTNISIDTRWPIFFGKATPMQIVWQASLLLFHIQLRGLLPSLPLWMYFGRFFDASDCSCFRFW